MSKSMNNQGAQDGRNMGFQQLKPRFYDPESDEETVVRFHLDLMRAHYKLWSDLHGRRYDAEYWNRLLEREQVGKKWAEELRKRIQDPDALLLVFTDTDDILVGFLYAEIRNDHLTFRREGFINEIYLHPDYRGRNLSKSVLARGERWFQERCVSHRHVFVTSNNLAAVKLYASLGFRVTDYRMSKTELYEG